MTRDEQALQRIADELGDAIEIVRSVSDAMACCTSEGDDEARADRRQRAREAYHDTMARIDTVTGMPAIEEAIETATRVRVTEEITEAACAAAGMGPGNAKRMTPIIEAAFRAAGFEVEE